MQPQPATQQLGQIKLNEEREGGKHDGKGDKEDKGDKGDKGDGKNHDWKQSSWKALEAAATTGVSLGVLGYIPPPHTWRDDGLTGDQDLRASGTTNTTSISCYRK